ncbi:MAG TPA: erythromycin esterase family protein [Longimicrobium sp.]|nr:erythromycin esterase family protein [Longimicrobium sp.]
MPTLVRSSILSRTLLPVLALALAGCEVAGTTEPSETEDLTWLQQNAVPFTTTNPGGSYDDLARFGQMVGDARIVGLGEATHGTKEFFTMKHRLVEYLVKEKGFTVFGIEATHTEAHRVNAYINGGPGDPVVLLTNLYFWTWNTREVADMLVWMREYNQTAPADKKLSFYGFDLQYSRVAMDTVIAYLRGINQPAADSADAHYLCYRNYQDRILGPPGLPYTTATPSVRQQCHAGVVAVHTMLERRAGEFTAQSGRRDYEIALRAARVVIQNEDLKGSLPQQGTQLRDAYMAENIAWMAEVAEPGEKVVLWAHNAHVSRWEPFMGVDLTERYGDAYVVVGFSFHRGKFLAVQPGIGLLPATAPPALAASYEGQFHLLGHERFYVDLRPLRDGAPEGALWLLGPRLYRLIGAGYRANQPNSVYAPHPLVDEYDIMIHVEETTNTVRNVPRYFD